MNIFQGRGLRTTLVTLTFRPSDGTALKTDLFCGGNLKIGCIGSHGMDNFHIYEGTTNDKQYLQALGQHMLP